MCPSIRIPAARWAALLGLALIPADAVAQAVRRGTVPSTDGVPIAYDVRGTGPALVFVHGWSCDRSYWAGQVDPFARRFQVVTIDLGGHGESGLGRRDWTIDSFGEDVAAVVNGLALQRVILIGHSMGGDVVTAAARLLPGRVAGLVWVDTYKTLGPGRSPDVVEKFVARFVPDFRDTTAAFVRSMFLPTSDPALVERVATDMASAPPAVAIPAIRSSFNYSRTVGPVLKELRLPVVAINPDNGPTDVAAMKAYGVDVIIMPGVGHFAMMEDPARFNELLDRAIARLTR